MRTQGLPTSARLPGCPLDTGSAAPKLDESHLKILTVSLGRERSASPRALGTGQQLSPRWPYSAGPLCPKARKVPLTRRPFRLCVLPTYLPHARILSLTFSHILLPEENLLRTSLSCLSPRLNSSKGTGDHVCVASSVLHALSEGAQNGWYVLARAGRECGPPSALLRLPPRAPLPGQQGFPIRVALRTGMKASPAFDGKLRARSRLPCQPPGSRSPPHQPQQSRRVSKELQTQAE